MRIAGNETAHEEVTGDGDGRAHNKCAGAAGEGAGPVGKPAFPGQQATRLEELLIGEALRFSGAAADMTASSQLRERGAIN
jgi:hypothetical protein